MLLPTLLVLAPLLSTATYSYKSQAPGTWSPPLPPAAETTHLDNLNLLPTDKLPPPMSFTQTKDQHRRQRRLLQDGDAAAGLEPQKVPHNWFGTGTYVAPKYAVMTGKEGKNVKRIINSALLNRTNCGGHILDQMSDMEPSSLVFVVVQLKSIDQQPFLSNCVSIEPLRLLQH